ncbi:MAG: hypothetical protein KME17_24350 [Cyanosarcina radialis HA8281-LM2]|jgi:hypothetical protein|nr:hypothetical protein [Cyanosarcina radialis HA8281-LM2]
MKIPRQLQSDLFELQSRLLLIIDEAATTERLLFNAFGETEESLTDLTALASVIEDAQDTYRRLSTLMSVISRSDPDDADDSMKLLMQTYARGTERIEPMTRSIQEVKIEWGLL